MGSQGPLIADAVFETRLDAQVPWQGTVVRLLLLTDLASVAVAVVVAYYARFVVADGVTAGLNYPLLAASLVAAWMGLLWAFRCYEPRLLGVGTEEFRRVL